MIYFKRTTDAESFQIDWSDALVDDDTISTSSWVLPAELTNEAESISDCETEVTIIVSGGVDGETYEMVNTIVSEAGMNLSRRIYLTVLDELLLKGVNSFASYPELLSVAALNQSLVQVLLETDSQSQQGALQQAWRNINMMPIEVVDTLYNPYYTIDSLDEAALDLLDPNVYMQLKWAQIVEADCLLGGEPLEDRRQSGMLSDTTGESGHFLRPARPVELPIYRKTARLLSGILNYSSARVVRAS